MTDAVIFQSFFRQVKHVKLYLCLSFDPIKYLLYGVQPPCRQDVEEKGKDAIIRKVLWLFDMISSCHQSGIPQLESLDINERVITITDRYSCINICHSKKDYDFRVLKGILRKFFSPSSISTSRRSSDQPPVLYPETC